MNGMTEVKVADLTGCALDYAVDIAISGFKPSAKHAFAWQYQNEDRKDYSTCWRDGGALIEMYGIGVAKFYEPVDGPIMKGYEWGAVTLDDSARMDGPTALIAVCRAIVTDKLGETVTLPSRLFQ